VKESLTKLRRPRLWAAAIIFVALLFLMTWARWVLGKQLLAQNLDSDLGQIHLVIKEMPSTSNPMYILTASLASFHYRCEAYLNNRIVSTYRYHKDSVRFSSVQISNATRNSWGILFKHKSGKGFELYMKIIDGEVKWQE
jgi:predicted PurR-regulated permease PerM